MAKGGINGDSPDRIISVFSSIFPSRFSKREHTSSSLLVPSENERDIKRNNRTETEQEERQRQLGVRSNAPNKN